MVGNLSKSFRSLTSSQVTYLKPKLRKYVRVAVPLLSFKTDTDQQQQIGVHFKIHQHDPIEMVRATNRPQSTRNAPRLVCRQMVPFSIAVRLTNETLRCILTMMRAVDPYHRAASPRTKRTATHLDHEDGVRFVTRSSASSAKRVLLRSSS